MTRPGALAIVMTALTLTGCGYQLGGKSDLMPATLHTIAIPAFQNRTIKHRLTEYIPGAIGRELISRSRYKVVADPNQADAVLNGTVVSYYSGAYVSDQKTGRASGIQIRIFLNIQLVDKASGKVLFQRDNLEVRGQYEVAVDQEQYFDESTTALKRASEEVARRVVSTLLEGF